MTKRQSQYKALIFRKTQIDTIISIDEYRNYIDVTGYKDNTLMNYRIYDNGKVYIK